MYRWTLVSTLTLAASIFSTVAVSAANEESKRIQSTVPVVELTLGPLTDTHEVDVGIPPTKQCGNDDRLIMPGMAWTVANSMYNSNQMEGTQCTNFQHVLEASDGTLLVEYTSITDIEQVTATEDICKGYSSIGIGVNLRKRLNQVQSIPASFQWNRTAGEEFKGANIFDFLTSPVEGAGESPQTNEFMLFVKIWGGQVPIGWSAGAVATLDLYGTAWKLYEGKNEASGQTVRSMIPDTPFEEDFTGDLKLWLDAMVSRGYASGDEFVNVGNGGTEVFYGKSQMEAIVSLNINI